MYAARIHAHGGPGILALEDVPPPEPSDGEILIKVQAAGVNPVDCMIRSGSLRPTNLTLPLTLGRDVSGVVESVAKDVSAFQPGDEVFACLEGPGGGYAEFAAVPADLVSLKPRQLDHEHAAAVPLAAITAWQALFDQGQLEPKQEVLIHGAGGGVGHFAVQFAKLRGAHVLATGKPEDLEYLRSLGVDIVIDAEHFEFEEVARDIDLVVDLVGGVLQKRSWGVTKNGGRIVSTVEQPTPPDDRPHQVQGIFFEVRPSGQHLARIARLLENEDLAITVHRSVPLAQAHEAHEILEREHSQGKVILKVEFDPGRRRTADLPHEMIAQRAYELWEAAGRPHGQDQVHWAQAERELEREGPVPLDERPRPERPRQPPARQPEVVD